jgi:hypothetical protein
MSLAACTEETPGKPRYSFKPGRIWPERMQAPRDKRARVGGKVDVADLAVLHNAHPLEERRQTW